MWTVAYAGRHAADRAQDARTGRTTRGCDKARVSHQRADQLVGQRDFLEPVGVLKAGRIWLRADVERWARDRRKSV
jgi:hypothetical protein